MARLHLLTALPYHRPTSQPSLSPSPSTERFLVPGLGLSWCLQCSAPGGMRGQVGLQAMPRESLWAVPITPSPWGA